MSDSTTPLTEQGKSAVATLLPSVFTPPGKGPGYATALVATYVMVIFVVLIAVAYLRNNDQMLGILTGVGATMAGAAVNYYLGSSAGSDKKTDLLAASVPAPAPLALSDPNSSTQT